LKINTVILCAAIYGASVILTACDSHNSGKLKNGGLGPNDALDVDENGYLRDRQADAYELYNKNKFNWNMWTYKIAGANMGNWSLYQAANKSKADPRADSFETVRQKWGETLLTFSKGTNDIANGFTAMRGMEQYFIPGINQAVK